MFLKSWSVGPWSMGICRLPYASKAASRNKKIKSTCNFFLFRIFSYIQIFSSDPMHFTNLIRWWVLIKTDSWSLGWLSSPLIILTFNHISQIIFYYRQFRFWSSVSDLLWFRFGKTVRKFFSYLHLFFPIQYAQNTKWSVILIYGLVKKLEISVPITFYQCISDINVL